MLSFVNGCSLIRLIWFTRVLNTFLRPQDKLGSSKAVCVPMGCIERKEKKQQITVRHPDNSAPKNKEKKIENKRK